MESRLFQELPISQRAEMLDANCNSKEEMTYHKMISPEGIEKVRSDFAQLAIEINAKEEEFKEIKDQFSEILKPMREEFKEALQIIKARQKQVKETVYILKDFAEGMLGVYNDQGELISSRRLTADENQLSLTRSFKIASNE